MNKKNIHAKQVLLFMKQESFKEPSFWLCLVLIPVSAIALNSAIPLLMSRILGKLAHGSDGQSFCGLLLLLAVSGLAGVVCNRLGFRVLMRTQARTTGRVADMAMKNLMEKSQTFYANQMTGKLVSDLISLDGAIIHFQDVIAISILPFAAIILSGICIVLLNSLIIGMALIVLTAFVIGSAVWNSKQRAPLRAEKQAARRELHGNAADVIINNQSVKVFAREDYELKRHFGLNTIFTDLRMRDWSRLNVDGNNRILGLVALQFAFVVTLIHIVTQNSALLPTAIFAFSFIMTITNRMFEIGTIIRTVEDSINDAAPMVAILAQPAGVTDSSGARALEVSKGAISIEKLTFTYVDTTKQQNVFHDLNLQIAPGEKIGLVGHSGSGKSTLVKLILRLSDVEDGAILIDGQDIAQVTQSSLHEAIAYVPQDPALFHRSIKDNIAYGAPTASDKAIVQAAKLAHADEFIAQLSEGYDTLVGERGVKLSGGQRQRITIARAMVKDAPILVLDEATSALDSESEVLIQDALWKLMEGRTAIVIAHRLSTIQKMDRIIVLDNGKIVEQGSHKELLGKKNGTYAKLWAHQSGGFIDE